jgi:AcrR family transcriptional regulator
MRHIARALAAPGLREQIVDVALRLLREHGMTKLVQAQVAREAGIPQGHLTYYFPRKSDLFAAVARRTIELLGQEVAQFVAGAGWTAEGPSARERALAVVESTIKDAERTRLLLGLVLEASEDGELRDLLVESARNVRMLLAGGMGRDPSDPDVEIMLATLWGLGVSHLIHRGRRPDAHSAALVARLPALLESFPPPVSAPPAPPRSTIGAPPGQSKRAGKPALDPGCAPIPPSVKKRVAKKKAVKRARAR